MATRAKTIRRALRRPMETLSFRLAMLAIPRLPRRGVAGLAHLAGSLAYLFGRRERRIGLANLDAVYGSGKTDAEKRAILRTSMRTFAQTMADLFWFSVRPEKRVPTNISFADEASVLFSDRAQILVTAHYGNWELLGLAICLRGMNTASIAATTKNPAVDRLLRRLRERTGQVVIAREGALRTLVNRLRNGGKVGFVLDQNTRVEEGGIWVDFLGRPTPLSAAPAALAYRTGTEIVFLFSRPIGGGRYVAEVSGVLQPPPYDKAADSAAVAAALTQQIADAIGEQIRSRPGFWLWSYKHWREAAPGADPAIYPRYR